jgi:hypothetical protein
MAEQEVSILSDSEESKTGEMSIQTPTHIVESFKDPKYSWNEWELRKRAIQIVQKL